MYVKRVQTGKLVGEKAVDFCNIMAKRALEQGDLNNLGDLETYARQKDMPIHFAAVPVEELTLPPDLHCVDALTGEPRPYMFSFGFDDLDRSPYEERIRELCALDPEANIQRLANESGFLMRITDRS
jgi:hypothetical protein